MKSSEAGEIKSPSSCPSPMPHNLLQNPAVKIILFLGRMTPFPEWKQLAQKWLCDCKWHTRNIFITLGNNYIASPGSRSLLYIPKAINKSVCQRIITTFTLKSMSLINGDPAFLPTTHLSLVPLQLALLDWNWGRFGRTLSDLSR